MCPFWMEVGLDGLVAVVRLPGAIARPDLSLA